MKLTENVIDDLLRDENLPEVEKSKPLPLIRPDLEKDFPTPVSNSGLERRQFTRADIAEKKLELKFSNGLQFARQYIENISLGGLFVKTEMRPEMGAIIPIEFSIPQSDEAEPKYFQLRAKVCRITDQGVGLEFLDLTDAIRNDLETYIRSVLPEGIPVVKAKQTTIENLEKLREEKAKKALQTRRTALKLAAMIGLIVVNAVEFTQITQTNVEHVSEQNREIQIGDQKVNWDKIEAIGKDSTNEIVIYLVDGSSIKSSLKAIDSQLPYHLQQSTHLVETLATPKPVRQSKTSVELTQLK